MGKRLTFLNINQPDISLKSAGDRVNLCVKLGASRKFNFVSEISSLMVKYDDKSVVFKKENYSIYTIIDGITGKYGVSKNMLLEKNTNRATKTVRALIAYIGVNKLGMSNEEISKILKITNGAVCKMITRNKVEFDKYSDKSIKEMIKK